VHDGVPVGRQDEQLGDHPSPATASPLPPAAAEAETETRRVAAAALAKKSSGKPRVPLAKPKRVQCNDQGADFEQNTETLTIKV
jgi:hypothetical protein